MGIKSKFKNILGYNTYIRHSEYKKDDTFSLNEFIKNHPGSLGKYAKFVQKEKGLEYSPAIKEINDNFDFLMNELDKYNEEGYVPIDEIYTVKTGNPLRYKPFPMCKEYMLRMCLSKNLYRYPSVIGFSQARSHFVDYLIREGFDKDSVGMENVVFTYSTTHAFDIILDLIMRKEDVVLVTGPNYGIFAVMPERKSGRVEVIDLKEEDNFFVNPKSLSKKIDEINEQLKKKWEGKMDYIPRVVAFLNENPHNPIGNVMNKKNLKLFTEIADVCLEKGVFIIDDLIYRDLTFDLDDLAFPIASIPKYFNNTISLFGLSKSYGLAAMRSGVIVAPIPIANALKDKIFASVDSMSVMQVWTLIGAFNGSNRRYKLARKYFIPLINEYKYRFSLLRALIEGIDVIDDIKTKKRITKEINKYASNEKLKNALFKGIKNVEIRKKTYPKSGFFAIVDFTKTKNHKYNGNIINNEADLVRYLYKTNKFRSIMGGNMSWPYKDEIISRFDFAIDIPDLIHNIEQLYEALSEDFVCVEKLKK